MYRHRLCLIALGLAFVAASPACTIRDDSTRANQLESLRVLGIASEPADLISGETAALSALVYEPDGNPVSYQWSWCISRAGSDKAFACNYEEAELQAAWAELDTGTILPSYDLGSDETASFALNFEAAQVVDLCTILTRDEANLQEALFSCLSGLGLSIELRVSSGDQEVVALRDITVLQEGEERNLNPQLGPDLLITDQAGGELAADDPLRAEAIYDLVADVAEDQSEVFTPAPQEGLPPPEARGESLFLSWFITQGATHRKGEQRTSFNDGGDFTDLVENVWEMPFDPSSDQARIFLVLRDERGGTSWIEHSYSLLGAR